MIDVSRLKKILSKESSRGLFDCNFLAMRDFPANVVFNLENKKVADLYKNWTSWVTNEIYISPSPSVKKLSKEMMIDLRFFYWIENHDMTFHS